MDHLIELHAGSCLCSQLAGDFLRISRPSRQTFFVAVVVINSFCRCANFIAYKKQLQAKTKQNKESDSKQQSLYLKLVVRSRMGFISLLLSGSSLQVVTIACEREEECGSQNYNQICTLTNIRFDSIHGHANVYIFARQLYRRAPRKISTGPNKSFARSRR